MGLAPAEVSPIKPGAEEDVLQNYLGFGGYEHAPKGEIRITTEGATSPNSIHRVNNYHTSFTSLCRSGEKSESISKNYEYVVFSDLFVYFIEAFPLRFQL